MTTEQRNALRELVDEAGRPAAQIWPLRTFAYRNPLRGYEHLPFDEAVRAGSREIGGAGYLANREYRELYRLGRITRESLQSALQRLGPHIEAPPVQAGDRAIGAADVHWRQLTEGFEALDPALLAWTASAEGGTDLLHSVLEVADLGPGPGGSSEADLPGQRTLGDWLDARIGSSVVEQVNDQMTKWSAAFLDEGLAGWGMPGREAGFYRAWKELAGRDRSARFLGIRDYARRIQALPDAPEEAIEQALRGLEIPPDRWGEYQARLCGQLPGWTGFMRWRSENPQYPGQRDHPASLADYLAVRLFYEAALVEAVCRHELGLAGTLPAIRDRLGQLGADSSPAAVSGRPTAAWLYPLAKGLELTPEQVRGIEPEGVRTLLEWLQRFPEDRHGPVWLTAYEDSYAAQFTRRLADHQSPDVPPDLRPEAQLLFCIDARSEPFRSRLEAQGPYETFGYAGFFGVPISHQPFDSGDRLALCPVLLKPQRAVDEAERTSAATELQRYASGTRWRRLGDELLHDIKQNPAGAFALIDLLGVFFSVGLAGKTLSHRTYARVATWARGRFRSSVPTHVPVARPEAPAEPPRGFTLDEQAAFVGGGLRMIGLTDRLARLVVICGHGAESENNPYAAAYNCGACGGAHGDPNARAFAAMANDPAVRRRIAEGGLQIPDDTWFLPAKHDTTTDRVRFYDEADVPPSHRDDLDRLRQSLDEAGARQAAERLGRLPGAPRGAAPQRAAEHALGRSVDWANPRPEWGLSSNASFLIGRRARTQGLDLESRTFLHSYDPVADSDGSILEKIMTAPLIVGEWINMEYYFSSVDPWVYGSGSKVVHNVVGGVGVMLGSQSDLQGGLPLQGVAAGAQRYHEPMRLLAIIEAPTERISRAIRKHAALQTLFHNQWVNLLALDPDGPRFHRYRPDATWERLPTH